MGKNYVENSLKRFLKRKVKITMGVVVSFLITGAVAFGANNENYEDYIVDTGIALEIENEETFTNYGNIETTGTGPVFKVNGSGVLFNHGNVTVKRGTALNTSNKEIHNYGTISGTWNVINASNKEELKIYNYKDIISEKSYSITSSAKETFIYNYGTIKAKSSYIVQIPENSYLYIDNYGEIVVSSGNHIFGEISENKVAKIKNNGKIDGNLPIMAIKSSVTLPNLENYGFLKGSVGLQVTLENQKDEEENIKNYGTIQSGITVTGKQTKTSLLNLGLIKGNVPTNSGATGGVNNKGVIIATNKDINTFNWAVFDNNQGAVLQKQDDGTYKLLNTDTLENNKQNETIIAHGVVKDMSDKTEINSTNTADNMFINNKSLTLNLGDKVTGKTITTVSQAKGNVVLDNDIDGDKVSGNNNLTLDNTSIIGYFEKDGTLLKVDGDLTLTGNSIINAVAARDENGDILKDAQNVVAVDVFGKLTYTEGESHIFGTIKGGEGSKIVVNGTETTNPNELTETLSSSGNIYLNGQKWTKGETGSIELTGGTVHIDDGNGTLVGYLAKEENPTTKAGENVLNTTLDGMITGKGTLNVNEIRFDLGNLEINNMEDTYKVNGNKDIVVQDALNKINVSGIFKKEIKDGDLVLSLKSAEEMGIYDPSKQKEYEELVKNFKDSEEFYNLVNTGNAEAIRKYLNVLDKVMELLGTAGVKITRDITGAFTDAVVEFDKKANKGEWLTNAKYIGSDMEYDGTKHINGYDSDIKSMIGMAEYGITENTSLGFALGGGDTEVDLKTFNGKSTSFDGKNYYAGIYAKHSMNGFDMTGSLGYTISDLDVEKGGSADSEAVTLAGYIKKDVYVTDTVKLEPNLSFTYDYIMQDKAEMGEGMTIDSGDSHVFEAGAGLNLVKEFALEKGSLKLKTGVKYSMTNIERNKDVTGKFYNADVNLGSPDIDDKEGKAHVGFDYEHETGFGVNGKYEMMWSDSGDDSRITAGISYRF